MTEDLGEPDINESDLEAEAVQERITAIRRLNMVVETVESMGTTTGIEVVDKLAKNEGERSAVNHYLNLAKQAGLVEVKPRKNANGDWERFHVITKRGILFLENGELPTFTCYHIHHMAPDKRVADSRKRVEVRIQVNHLDKPEVLFVDYENTEYGNLVHLSRILQRVLSYHTDNPTEQMAIRFMRSLNSNALVVDAHYINKFLETYEEKPQKQGSLI